MPTIEVGQWIEQIEPERVWSITGQTESTMSGQSRWRLRLEIPGPNDGGDRYVGQATTCSETWLNTYCRDYRTGVDPPQGDGEQTVRYTIMDGTVGELVCETAFEAIAQAKGWLEANQGFGQVEWFGWAVSFSDQPLADPDLICTMVNGELEWSEYRIPVS